MSKEPNTTAARSTANHAAPVAAPAKETPAMNTTANTAQASAPANAAYGTSPLKLDGHELNLPNKFGPGMTLDDAAAAIINAFYARQFRNNQEANAKARAERLAKAKTDAERAANAPLTATALSDIWATYAPTVGDTPRADAMEKMANDAAWRYWSGMITAHNKSVDAGTAPVFPERPGVKLAMPVKEKKDAHIAGLRKSARHADGIQATLDAMIAERTSKKATTKAETAASDDLI